MIFCFTHNAMATQFELRLCGADPAHLQSVAYMAWEEVDRLELLMSMHDPRAEIARINREAYERPVRIDVELFRILSECQRWHQLTNGYFDVAYAGAVEGGHAWNFDLDEKHRTVQLLDEKAGLDLGGFGKGYALDRIRVILQTYGITSAFMHGGTSSVLAMGMRENNTPWIVDIPHFNDSEHVLLRRPVVDQGFSYSSVDHTSNRDIYDPHGQEVRTSEGACWVVAPRAIDAEVLTTALVAMGKSKAEEFMTRMQVEQVEMGWI